MTDKKILAHQLTLQDEVEKITWRKRKECRHVFSRALPVFDFEQDKVYYFAICAKCGYKTE